MLQELIMTRFDWLKKHEVHLERGDVVKLQEDFAYCRARRDLARRSSLRRAWDDRVRVIERRLRDVEAAKEE